MASGLRSFGTGLFEGLTENIEQARKDKLERAKLEGEITGAGGTIPQRTAQSGVRNLLGAVGLANQGGTNIEDLIRQKTQALALEKKRKRQKIRFDELRAFIDNPKTGEIDIATIARSLDEFPDLLRKTILKGLFAGKNKLEQAKAELAQLREDPNADKMEVFRAAVRVRALQGKFKAPQQGQGFTLGPGQTRFGPQGKQIAQGQEKTLQGFTLGAGQTRFDAEGKEIATGGERTPTLLSPERKELLGVQTRLAEARLNELLLKKTGRSLTQMGPKQLESLANSFSRQISNILRDFSRSDEERKAATNLIQAMLDAINRELQKKLGLSNQPVNPSAAGSGAAINSQAIEEAERFLRNNP